VGAQASYCPSTASCEPKVGSALLYYKAICAMPSRMGALVLRKKQMTPPGLMIGGTGMSGMSRVLPRPRLSLRSC
jgi:hypothetical protein